MGIPRPRSPRALAIVTALMIIAGAAACTAGPDDAPTPATHTSGPAVTSFPPAAAGQSDVPVGDQVDQSLAELAADGSTVVAVGQDTSANVTRPLLLRSTDGGRSWQRSSVDPEAGGAPGPSESAQQVAHGAKGFVAFGPGGDDQGIVWRSSDGHRWSRSPVDKAVLRNGDAVSDLAANDNGFMMIGSNNKRHGATLGSLLTWTSPDGRSWSRHEIPSAVLGGVAGVPSATQLVVGEHEMIMTGDVENAGDTRQPNRILILRSTDDGASWTKINTPADLAGDYRAYAEDLVFVDGRYLLLAQGDGADPDGDSWDAVVLSGGANGSSWRRIAAPLAVGSAADDYGEVLLPMPVAEGEDHGWLIAGSIGKSPSDGVITIGDRLDELLRRRVDALIGPRSQYVTDGLIVDGSALLLGSDGRTGSDDPMILRVEGTTVERVDLGDLGGTPIPDVDAVISAEGGYRAVGTLGQTPLLWTSPDGLSWRPQVLPARGQDGVIGAGASHLAAGPDGTAIAVGALSRDRGSRVGAWLIDRRGRPGQLHDPAFISPTPDDYGYLDPTAITHGAGGWVISAQHSANGHHDLWLLHSADGRHWTGGKGTVRARLDRDEKRDHRTVWTALRGPDNGDIVAARIVPVGRGFVALGAIHDGTSARPVAWRSDDGVTWTDPEDLPLRPGVSDVVVEAAAAAGSSVIVTGRTVFRVAAADQTRLSWRLDLDGPPASDTSAHWRVGKAARERSSILSVLPVEDGFLGVGDATVDGAPDARWWHSRDGLTWTPLRAPRGRSSGPGSQRIEKVVRSGNALLLWGWDVPPTGGGDYTARVPMPR